MMSVTFSRIAISAISLIGISSSATIGEAHPRSGSSTVITGRVSEVEGEFRMAKNSRDEDVLKLVDTSYVIITRTGQEIHLKLNRETKVPARANPGDRIKAIISNEGQTLSVTLIE